MLIGIFALILAFVVFCIIRKRAQATRCPHCGKLFAMREISRDSTPSSTYDTTTTVDLFEMDLKGNYTSGGTLTAPATAHTYKCTDVCRFCGFKKEGFRTQVRQK